MTLPKQVRALKKENKRLHEYILRYVQLAKRYNTPTVWIGKGE